MKKIFSFLTVSLLFGGFSTAKAELHPDLDPTQKIVVDEENMLFDTEELDLTGKQWYVVYIDRNGGGCMYDNVDFDDDGSLVRCKSNLVFNEFATVSKVGPALVRFVESETEGTCKMQFGTGRWLITENGGEWGGRLYVGEEADAAEVFVYVTESDGNRNSGCFAFNLATATGEYGYRFDTNSFDIGDGAYAGVVAWGSGVNTAASGNNIWTIYPVEFTNSSPLEAAFGEFQAILSEYESKLTAFQNKTSEDGTPGTYDKTLVQAFIDAFNEGVILEMEWEDSSVEALQAAGQKIIDTYNAAVASLVSSAMEVAPGYYFIASQRKFFEKTEDKEDEASGETIPGVTTYMNKYMYSRKNADGITARWSSLAEDATKAIYLWKITKPEGADKKYRVENVGTDATFTQSMPAMSVESDSLIQFDYIKKTPGQNGEQDTVFYTLRLANEASNIWNSFHGGGHGGGAGKEGEIVKYTYEGEMSSVWTLLPVSDEDAAAIIAAYEPVKGDADRQLKTQQIIAELEEKMRIAIDSRVEFDAETGLITSVEQLSSPHGDQDEGKDLGALLDGDKGTFWHSDWHGAHAAPHYLQVDLSEYGDLESIALEMTRRGNNGGHPVEMEVYGTNDPDAGEKREDCEEKLATIKLPYKESGEVVLSGLIPVKGFSYLRFYGIKTNIGDEGFWHAAEIQVYGARETANEHSQAKGMGEIFTNVQAAVEAAKAEGDAVTVETYQQLVAAAEAFNARFVNPDSLRNAIADNKDVSGMVVVGTNPGEWSDANVGQALANLITEAEAYDAAGVYYPAESAAKLKAIEDAKKAVFEAANKVNPRKWYNLRFATEQMYDDNEWSKSGADANRYSEEAGDNQDGDHWPSLYGKLVAVGQEETIETDSNFIYVSADIDTVSIGHAMRLVDEVEVEANADVAMFRFINVADTAYIIQNKATGLYLRAAGGSGAVTLSIQPTLWKNTAMGYGKVMTKGNDLLGNNNNNLHAQRDENRLVTWSSTGVETNTGFLIEEAEDVATDYKKNDFKMSLAPNAIYGFCYPMDVTPAEGANVYGVNISGTEITLNVLKDNTAKAGEPFVYITGTEAFDEEAEKELYEFTYGGTLNVVAATVGKHVGSYAATTAPKGSIIANGEGAFKAMRMNTNIPANRTWINAELENPREAEITHTIGEGVFDAIKDAVANATKGGKIYTVDGTYVGKGDINTVKGLKKGLYIVNGVKVLVK